MTATYNPAVHKLAVFVVCWTVLLFVAGALVTSNDAALSVPDWPKPHGSWFPPLETLTAGALFGVIAVAGVGVQAVLGGEVVLRLLHYWLPVIHACFAQIVFAAVLGIAVLTSRWWVTEKRQLEDKGTPSIHVLAGLNALVIYLQVILGAGFRHKEIPIWPHVAGALVVLGVVTWTAVALRKRFAESSELSRARIMLHAILGTQLMLGVGAWCSRLSTADAPQPMPVMGTLTVSHTVVVALRFRLAGGVVVVGHRLRPVV